MSEKVKCPKCGYEIPKNYEELARIEEEWFVDVNLRLVKELEGRIEEGEDFESIFPDVFSEYASEELGKALDHLFEENKLKFEGGENSG